MKPIFRLKFQTSQTTQLDKTIILEKIITKLNDKKYEVLEVKDDVITFGRPFFELMWRHEAPYILDGGSFNVIALEKEKTVVLNYYINTFFPLLVFGAFITFILIQEFYEGLFFFGAFFLITGLIQFFTSKNVGKKLLNDILTGEY